MATRYNIITEDNRHRYNGENCSPLLFAGNFELKGWRNMGTLIKLDEYDQRYTADVKLKAGEKIFRYHTRTTRAGSMEPLIKVNTCKGLIYFLTPEAMEQDFLQFETRAHRPEYINLMQTVIV